VYQLLFPNNKEYIGVTTDLDTRFSKHRSDKSKVVGKAITKYGWDNVKRDYKEFENEAEAYDYEAEIVDQPFVDSRNTYNQKLGGRFSPFMNQLIRDKISESKKGHETDEETRLRISNTLNPNGYPTLIHEEHGVHTPSTLQGFARKWELNAPDVHRLIKGGRPSTKGWRIHTDKEVIYR